MRSWRTRHSASSARKGECNTLRPTNTQAAFIGRLCISLLVNFHYGLIRSEVFILEKLSEPRQAWLPPWRDWRGEMQVSRSPQERTRHPFSRKKTERPLPQTDSLHN